MYVCMYVCVCIYINVGTEWGGTVHVQGATDGKLQRSAQEVQTDLVRATQSQSVSLRVDGPPPAATAAGTQFTAFTGTK
jgi:hypothetical protein